MRACSRTSWTTTGSRSALDRTFEPALLRGYAHCFNSMPIDEFFDYRFGPLPYRSIRFHHRLQGTGQSLGDAATINFTDAGPLTRQTDWSRLPHHVVRSGPVKTVTLEEPCDYTANGYERYYPVKTSDGRHQAVYRRYKALADALPGMTFIGRCGTYQYLDMHQVINQSLLQAAAWIAAVQGESAPPTSSCHALYRSTEEPRGLPASTAG